MKNEDRGKPRFNFRVQDNIGGIGKRITVDMWINVAKHKGKYHTKHIYYGVIGEGENLHKYTREDVIISKVKDYIKRGRYHDWDFYVEKGLDKV